MPEFYIIIAQKIFSRFFFWGGGHVRSLPPFPTPMTFNLYRLKIRCRIQLPASIWLILSPIFFLIKVKLKSNRALHETSPLSYLPYGIIKKVKKRIAVSGIPSHSYGTSLAIWDHTVLPATQHKCTRPALTPASKLVLDLVDLPIPEGWKAELT